MHSQLHGLTVSTAIEPQDVYTALHISYPPSSTVAHCVAASPLIVGHPLEQ